MSLLKSQRLDLTSTQVPTISAESAVDAPTLANAALTGAALLPGTDSPQSLVRPRERLADQAGQARNGANNKNQRATRQHRTSPTQPGR